MNINLKVANQSLVKRNFRIYVGTLLPLVLILVWASVSEWFSSDSATNKIIAYSIIGCSQLGFWLYNRQFTLREKIVVTTDGIITEQFNTIPFREITNYSPTEFTRWTDTITIRTTDGQEVAFTRIKEKNTDNTIDFIEFGTLIKENCPLKN